jgi:hypothetical protein
MTALPAASTASASASSWLPPSCARDHATAPVDAASLKTRMSRLPALLVVTPATSTLPSASTASSAMKSSRPSSTVRVQSGAPVAAASL